MMRQLVTVLVAAGLAAASLAAVSTPEDLTLYLRVDGESCPGTTYLSSVAGSDELNCGYIGGLPFSEVFYQAGNQTWGTETYSTTGAWPEETSGTPVNLDAERDVEGVIVVSSYVGIGGTGQIVVDLELTADTADGSETIGTTTEETLADPAASATEVPFTFDIADDLHEVEATDVTLSVNVRGAHVLHGFTRANGASQVTVPYLEVADESTQ